MERGGGNWKGVGKYPDLLQYISGHRNDGCKSLACIYGEIISRNGEIGEWTGRKVECHNSGNETLIMNNQKQDDFAFKQVFKPFFNLMLGLEKSTWEKLQRN